MSKYKERWCYPIASKWLRENLIIDDSHWSIINQRYLHFLSKESYLHFIISNLLSYLWHQLLENYLSFILYQSIMEVRFVSLQLPIQGKLRYDQYFIIKIFDWLTPSYLVIIKQPYVGYLSGVFLNVYVFLLWNSHENKKSFVDLVCLILRGNFGFLYSLYDQSHYR